VERARLEGAAEWDTPAMLAAIRRLVGPVPVPLERAAVSPSPGFA
jgi:hypothetical protein